VRALESREIESEGDRSNVKIGQSARKGKKDIVLPGTYVSDPINGRKRREWGQNGTRV